MSWLPGSTLFFRPLLSRMSWAASARVHSGVFPAFSTMSPRCVANTVFRSSARVHDPLRLRVVDRRQSDLLRVVLRVRDRDDREVRAGLAVDRASVERDVRGSRIRIRHRDVQGGRRRDAGRAVRRGDQGGRVRGGADRERRAGHPGGAADGRAVDAAHRAARPRFRRPRSSPSGRSDRCRRSARSSWSSRSGCPSGRRSRCGTSSRTPAKKPDATPVEFIAVPSAACWIESERGARLADGERAVEHAVEVDAPAWSRRSVAAAWCQTFDVTVGAAGDRVVQPGASDPRPPRSRRPAGCSSASIPRK